MKYNKIARNVMVVGILISLSSIMALIIDILFFEESYLPIIILSFGIPLWLGGYLLGGAEEEKGGENK